MNFKLRSLVAATLAGSMMMGFGANAMADSTDDILNALIAKGVLTEEEGALLQKGRTGEKEAAAKKKESEIKASFKDGIKWESGDKANSMSINGRVQLDSRSNDINGGTTANTKIADTYEIRRAYLGAKGTFAKYYDFEVTIDTASSAALDVAYMNLHWWDQAQFQFGQFKMPFSLEERTSSRFIDFQERSFVNNGSLTPGKEIGVMLHGTPVTGLNYAIALSTGQGKNTLDTDQREDGKDIVLHADANLAEMMGNKDAVMHIGASYSNGDLPPAAISTQRTEGRGLEFFQATAPSGTTMERTRYGLETALAYGPVKLQGEYSEAKFEGTNASSVSYDKSLDASYVEALWLVTGENYADAYKKGKFDRIKPKNDFNPDFKGGLGAVELGIRYSKFDATDFDTVANGAISNTPVMKATTAGTTSFTNKADAYTVGLKWIPTANARVLLTYVKTNFDTPVIAATGETVNDEKVLMMRTQYDF
ncbi:OprP Phosphate-selective porin [Methylophilaceae bacterium]